MRGTTLEKIQTDSTLSNIQRMAAGCVLDTRKKNGHRNLPQAAVALQKHYNLPYNECLEYVTDIANEADDREWNS